MPRNIRSIQASWFRDPNIVAFHFLRMYWAAPVGTLRWTTHPADSITLDIHDDEADGDQVWDGTQEWTPGQFETGEQNALAVSDITFGNANREFSDKMLLFPYGVRGVQMDVWLAAFTATKTIDPAGTPAQHHYIDSIQVYSGTADRAEVGDEVRVSLLAFRNPLTAKFPRRRFTLAYGFEDIPKVGLKFQFGTQVVALPTSNQPSAPGTGGGGSFVPPPGSSTPTTRMPVIPGPTRGKPQTRGGRSTRTVNR